MRSIEPTPRPPRHILLVASVLAAVGLLAFSGPASAQPGAAIRHTPASNPFGSPADDPFGAPLEVPFLSPGVGSEEMNLDQFEALLNPSGLVPEDEGEPKTEEEKQAAALVQAHLQVDQLPRSPGQILQVQATRAAEQARTQPAPEGEEDGQSAKIHAFYGQVATGDWQAVKQYLAAQPEKVGPKVYDHLLDLLGNQMWVVLLPDEIPLLADASPSELNEKQLAVLGRLLSQSLPHVGRPSAMLATIAAGTEKLGGNDPARRIAAARMLTAAGMLDEAARYLPPLDAALKAGDPLAINLHASYQQALGSQKLDRQTLRRAWDLTQTVLDMPQVDVRPRSEALLRTLMLMPSMPADVTAPALHRIFRDRPALGMQLVAQAAMQVEMAFAQKRIKPRLQALAAQRNVADVLLSIAKEGDDRWSTAITMTMLGWITEAQYTAASAAARSDAESENAESEEPDDEDVDMPTAITDAYSASVAELIASYAHREIPPLPAEKLFPLCPDDAWRRAVPADMARHAERLNGRLAAAVGDRERTFAAIGHLSDSAPDQAKQLAEQFVRTWIRKRSGSEEEEEESYRYGIRSRARYNRSFSYGGYSPYSSSGGIPLTRAKQVRDLKALAEMLGEIKALGVPPLEPEVLIEGFTAIHSPAEVYRAEDIQTVFGGMEQLAPKTLLGLVAAMRASLAGQWRAPEVQEQMNTRRTDKQQVAEVMRGYELAVDLARGAVEKLPRNAEPLVLLASVHFDEAEFLYGQKADLKTYTTIRDQAFAGYRRAAEVYAQSLPELPESQQSIEVYQQWFRSSLGASDLAYLARQDRPDLDQIEQLVDAVNGLPPEAVDRHLAMFGEAITASVSEVPPQLKPYYLREAVRVLGDHPGGEKARELLASYDDLLGEIELHVAVDGPAEVGHNRPFGAHLSIRNTLAVGRESGGFGHLLDKSYSYSTGQQVDHKEKIEEVLREKLSESFEIQSIQFHDPQVAPRGFGRFGWRETPLAYLILRAQDPATDRIPMMHVDLEFNDGAGMVLLPITSQVVLIDARQDDPSPRPSSELTIQQTLDDRRYAEGSLRLEVDAAAKGLIPDLDGLLALDRIAAPGLTVSKVEDLGLEIDSLDASGEQVWPKCRRRWLIDLEPAGDRVVDRFEFPKVQDPAVAVKYQRYDDADIVDTAGTVALRLPPWTRVNWLWIGGGSAGFVLLCLAGALTWRRARRWAKPLDAGVYRRPEPLTPFNLLALLERIKADHGLDLPAAHREDLQSTIDELERKFFRPGAVEPEPSELVTVLDRWLDCATNGHRR